MKPERRWLKSVIAASAAQDMPAMPWARRIAHKPVVRTAAVFKHAPALPTPSIAAR